MSLRSQFATNSKSEIEGIAVKYAPNDDGTEPTFIVARAGGNNKEYSKTFEKVTRPYRRTMDSMPPEQAKNILMDIFVESILKGWEHVQDENGVELPFTKENAIALFKDLPDLYADLSEKSSGMALFKQEALDAEAKN